MRVDKIAAETAPPGWDKVVERLKDHPEVDNPFALANWMAAQGYQPMREDGEPYEAEALVKRARFDAGHGLKEGDKPGHPFRGNQFTDGAGGGQGGASSPAIAPHDKGQDVVPPSSDARSSWRKWGIRPESQPTRALYVVHMNPEVANRQGPLKVQRLRWNNNNELTHVVTDQDRVLASNYGFVSEDKARQWFNQPEKRKSKEAQSVMALGQLTRKGVRPAVEASDSGLCPECGSPLSAEEQEVGYCDQCDAWLEEAAMGNGARQGVIADDPAITPRACSKCDSPLSGLGARLGYCDSCDTEFEEGDKPGHPFRGNQYTDGQGGGDGGDSAQPRGVPRLESLNRDFGDEKGQKINAVLSGKVDPESYASVARWVSKAYNPPAENELKMKAINEILDGYGVEAIWGKDSFTQPVATYVNMGDTYDATVVYDYEKRSYQVTSWGDWVEEAERRGIELRESSASYGEATSRTHCESCQSPLSVKESESGNYCEACGKEMQEGDAPGHPFRGKRESSIVLVPRVQINFTRLREAEPSQGGLPRVVLITAGPGNRQHGNFYPPEILKRDAKVFEGVKCFLDHPGAYDEKNRPEREVTGIAGWFSGVDVAELDSATAAVASFNYCQRLDGTLTEPGETARGLVESALVYARQYPNEDKVLLGFSINGGGPTHRERTEELVRRYPQFEESLRMRDEWNVSDGIEVAYSVDLVTVPARGGRVLSLREAETRFVSDRWRNTFKKVFAGEKQ